MGRPVASAANAGAVLQTSRNGACETRAGSVRWAEAVGLNRSIRCRAPHTADDAGAGARANGRTKIPAEGSAHCCHRELPGPCIESSRRHESPALRMRGGYERIAEDYPEAAADEPVGGPGFAERRHYWLRDAYAAVRCWRHNRAGTHTRGRGHAATLAKSSAAWRVSLSTSIGNGHGEKTVCGSSTACSKSPLVCGKGPLCGEPLQCTRFAPSDL